MTDGAAKPFTRSRWNPFMSWRPGNKNAAKLGDRPTEGANPEGQRPPGVKPSPSPRPGGGPAHARQQTKPPPPPQMPTPKHAAGSAATQQGDKTMTDGENLRPRDDTSLQGWGRTLGKISPAVTQTRQRTTRLALEQKAMVDALSRIAQQGDDGTLPASRPLAAEVEALAAEARKVYADQEAIGKRWEQLQTRAEVLPHVYQREHDTDERRLAGERGGRHVEKRADVTTAEQDT